MHDRWAGVTGSPQDRLQHGKEAFTRRYGKDDPGVITFSSCLWDLYAKGEQGPDLHEDYLNEYGDHLSDILRQLGVSLCGPVICE